jgi:cytochrome c553
MPDTTSQILTSAKFPIELDGKEFLMSPLNDQDIAELDLWMSSYYLKMVRASLEDETNQALRDETIRVASREALSLSIMTRDGQKILATVNGMTRLLWQSIKLNHPNVTVHELRAMLLSKENMTRVNEAFAKTNPVSKNEHARPQTQKKKNRRSK